MSGDVKIRCLLGRRMVNWIDGMEMEIEGRKEALRANCLDLEIFGLGLG